MLNSQFEQQLSATLDLGRRPVAVAYRAEIPQGIARLEGAQPSGCSFWQLAASGRSFYTVAADHYNCPIGSYTHNVPLPEDRQSELMQTLGMMAGAGYLRMEEIPSVFRLSASPTAIVYAPLGELPFEPDVVLVSGLPGRLMLLVESAIRAGVYAALPLLARPTCMALPAAMQKGVVISAGCIGNRVYTGVGEEDLYAAIPGSALAKLCSELETIRAANETLAEYHRARLSLRTQPA
jgi:uncharacterized protein (DUF169 family)